MEFYQALQARRSIRAYTAAPVSREVLERVLDAGRWAPSWKNRQCWRYVLVSGAEAKAYLASMLTPKLGEGLLQAPYGLALCADPTDSGTANGKEYFLVDCGLCMQCISLAAAAEGLGTCWGGLFPERPVKNLLGLPADIQIVAITPLGYPAEAPEPPERLPLSSILYAESWHR